MDNTTIKKMEDKVNYMIRSANRHWEKHGWDNMYNSKLARIEGALDILSIATGKDYYYDENGLKIG